MRPEDCASWSSCSAPMCPLDPMSRKGIWYPCEDVCNGRAGKGSVMVRQQRKIARKAGDDGIEAGYFTHDMLQVTCTVRKGIRGLNPDHEEGPQLARWMEGHKPRRKLSEAEKQELRARASRMLARRRSSEVETGLKVRPVAPNPEKTGQGMGREGSGL